MNCTEDPSVFEVLPPARNFHFPSFMYCRLVTSFEMPISDVFSNNSSTKPFMQSGYCFITTYSDHSEEKGQIEQPTRASPFLYALLYGRL